MVPQYGCRPEGDGLWRKSFTSGWSNQYFPHYITAMVIAVGTLKWQRLQPGQEIWVNGHHSKRSFAGSTSPTLLVRCLIFLWVGGLKRE
jgi:hypothetical protein